MKKNKLLFFNCVLSLIFILTLNIGINAQEVLFNNLDELTSDFITEDISGQQFMTSSSLTYINSVELSLYKSTGVTAEFTVSIYSDNSDQIGTKIADIYSGSAAILGESEDGTFLIDANNDLDNVLPISLSASTKYWIYVNLPIDVNFNYTDIKTGNGDGFLVRNYVFSQGYYNIYPYKIKIIANSVLPVELTSFTAKVSEKKVLLIWQTATEVNNYGFEIERQMDNGKLIIDNWEKVGFIKGNGNSNSPKEYSFVDESVFRGKYSYRLKQIDNDGKHTYSDVVNVEVGNIPTDYVLYQNYPNPFNPSTTIKFGLPKDSHITLEVFNIIGERVATVVNNELTAGYHSIDFNGSNLSSGIYLYKITAGEFKSTKKFMLMK